MIPSTIFSETTSYTFSDYFKLVDYLEDILAHFGYKLVKHQQNWNYYSDPLPGLATLKARFNRHLPHISLNNEISKREFLIAPILLELIDYTQVNIRSEYPLIINDQLKGTLDYYLQSQHNLLIIEAKNSDLERGFMQLAVELIALDKCVDNASQFLYGAVSTGEIWRFGIVERETKTITQDLNLFRVPADLEELLRILITILTIPNNT